MNADVLVLGAGGMGGAACWQLARRGAKVIAIERFTPGHPFGSSHGETRIIRKAYFEHPDYVPLLERSYELWGEASRETGARLYHETGIAYFCPPGSGLLGGVLSSASRHGIAIERLGPGELAGLADRLACPDGYVAVREPAAGFLEVENCVIQMTKLAERAGARVVSSERALSWSAESWGVEVRTDRGVYRARSLVIAAGAWSGEVLAGLGLPLRILRKTLHWFPAREAWREDAGSPCFLYDLPEGVFYGFPVPWGASHPWVKAALHSGGEEIAGPEQLDREPAASDATATEAFAASRLRSVTPRAEKSAVCMYVMTPDENFIIDRHPEFPNVCFAAGFSGHGFKFAPVVGEILAELALEGRTRHPAGFLGLRRFGNDPAPQNR